MQMLGLCIFINIFFFSSHGLQPFKVYNLQKLKQNTTKNISLTTFESQILINSSILPVAAKVQPPPAPLFLPVGTRKSHSQGWLQPVVLGLCGPGLQPLSRGAKEGGGDLAVQSLHLE